MFTTFDLFDYKDINEVVPEVIYYYLFEGLSLNEIEVRLFNTSQYKGWFSKTLLNYYHINTDGSNRAIYKNKNISEIVELLENSTNFAHRNVAVLLMKKYIVK